MEKDEFVIKICQSFNWLIELGYQFKQIETNIYFEKAEKDVILALGFSWAEYDRFLIQGIRLFKGFNSVESIISKVTDSHLRYTITKCWEGQMPRELESIEGDNKLAGAFFVGDNESDLNIFSSCAKDFFLNDGKAFFGKYQDLASILKSVDPNSNDKGSELIVNYGNSSLLRIMTIKYLVNPKDGIQFYNNAINDLLPLKNQRTFSLIIDRLTQLKILLSELNEN